MFADEINPPAIHYASQNVFNLFRFSLNFIFSAISF